MKIAIVGSRNMIPEHIEEYVTDEDEIVSGGAVGVDQYAATYARNHALKLTEFLPQYTLYGRAAPIIRNKAIVDYCDQVVAFWDGRSNGTLSVIKYAKKIGKPCTVVLINTN